MPDVGLHRHSEGADPAELVEALVHRAELALLADDGPLAGRLLDEAGSITLDDLQRDRARAALDRAGELSEPGPAS